MMRELSQENIEVAPETMGEGDHGCQIAKFDSFLFFGFRQGGGRGRGGAIQGKEGIKFCYLATMVSFSHRFWCDLDIFLR